MNFLEHLNKEFACSKEAVLHTINKLPDAKTVVVNVGMGVLSHDTGLLNIRSFKNFIKDISELVNANLKRRAVIVVSDSLKKTGHRYFRQSDDGGHSAKHSFNSALSALVHNDIVNIFYDGFLNYNIRVIGFSVSSAETDAAGELNKKLRTIKGIASSETKPDDVKLKAIRDLLSDKRDAGRGTAFKAKKTAETIRQLFKNFPRVVPIIMEDVSKDDALCEEDDGFATMIALSVGADALVSISGKGMLYTADPAKTAKALPFYCFDTGRRAPFDDARRAELAAKLNAAKKVNARNKSIPMILTPYNSPYTVRDLFDRNAIDKICADGEYPNFTIFINSQKVELPIERRPSAGSVVIDDNAAKELLNTSSNLLSVGIINILGEFGPKSVVSIVNKDLIEIGRGVVKLSSGDIKKTMGQPKGGTVISRQKMHVIRRLTQLNEKQCQ
ncbi:MAG: hypothetical protein LBI38_05300 [Oscillospiraceae bacterium]|jgi:glutamate 5-kinase|nr:hypothetical protein [Oscillospiraceae bacterium]